MEDIILELAYLAGALADGGCYYYKYRGGRSEYRCVWTQEDLSWLKHSIKPRLAKIMLLHGIRAKIQFIKGYTRYEVRVSSKKLYQVIWCFIKRHEKSIMDLDIENKWLAGLYDAEGDKKCRRVRIWNKDITILLRAKRVLEMNNIRSNGPYLDDKRHNVYVLEVPSPYRRLFLHKIKPEHPKLRSCFHV